jgi:hypothetical protein
MGAVRAWTEGGGMGGPGILLMEERGACSREEKNDGRESMYNGAVLGTNSSVLFS